MPDRGIDEDTAFREIEERLTAKYADVPADRVAQIVREVRAEMTTAKVRDFVAVLAEREAKDRVKRERKEATAADGQ